MGFPKAQWLTSSSLPAFRSAGHVTPQILMLSRRTSNDAAPCRRDRDGRTNDRRGGGRHPRTACARSGRRSSSRRRAIFTSIYRVIGNLTGPGGRDMSSLARRDVLEKTYTQTVRKPEKQSDGGGRLNPSRFLFRLAFLSWPLA